MPYSRNRFRDPLGLLLFDAGGTEPTYTWHINHSSEEASEQKRNIERTAPTGGVGFVRQQGDRSPVLLKMTGTILHAAQKDAMDAYFAACDRSTIFFRGIDGVEHEAIITDFNAPRQRGGNPKDPTIPLHYWNYTIEIELIG